MQAGSRGALRNTAGRPEPPPGPVLFHSSTSSLSFFPFCYGTSIGNWVMKEAERGALFLAFKNARRFWQK